MTKSLSPEAVSTDPPVVPSVPAFLELVATVRRNAKAENSSTLPPPVSASAPQLRISTYSLPNHKGLIVTDGASLKLIKDTNGVYPLNGILQVSESHMSCFVLTVPSFLLQRPLCFSLLAHACVL